jgi:hypothetical protein
LSIRIVPYHQIDPVKWDALVEKYADSPIYNTTQYLNSMSDTWKGLIFKDYEAILALPIKEKMGISLLTNPPFLQKNELIGTSDAKANLLPILSTILRNNFKLIDFNIANLPAFTAEFKIYQRNNLVHSLHNDYFTIKGSYTKLAKRKIQKANQQDFVFKEEIDAKQIIREFVTFYNNKIAYTHVHLEHLIHFIHQYPHHIYTCGVEQNGVLLYSCLLLRDKKRLYYLISAPTLEGQQLNATYWCIDQIIQKHANQALILDFEGSEIPEIAFFYSRFGARSEPYWKMTLNKLPFGLKQLINYKLHL